MILGPIVGAGGLAMSTPPFGMLLFVMKGSAPPGTSPGDICLAAMPFLACDLIVMIILPVFPAAVLFFQGLMLRRRFLRTLSSFGNAIEGEDFS